MPDSKMPIRVDDPGYWRFRAHNTRQMAKEMKEGEAKDIILKIASATKQSERIMIGC